MAKFELYKDSASGYRWRLKSANGQVIATAGESYTSKSGAQNGINAVQRDAAERRSTTLLRGGRESSGRCLWDGRPTARSIVCWSSWCAQCLHEQTDTRRYSVDE
jgi:uncharacterized protein